MPTEVVIIDCIAPIAVGHTVEVRLLKEQDGGFFSRRSGSKYQLDQPWVRDLDTGIEYGVYWQYSDTGAIQNVPGNGFPGKLRTDLEQERTYKGKVKACRVLTTGTGGGEWRGQTRLEVETS